MTDIVERLREEAHHDERGPLLHEAADEIKRLRAEVAELRHRGARGNWQLRGKQKIELNEINDLEAKIDPSGGTVA